MRVLSVALAFQLVSAPVGTAGREKESESDSEREAKKKKKAERRNTKNFIRTTTRKMRAVCLYVKGWERA
jgi:hypothetical protein